MLRFERDTGISLDTESTLMAEFRVNRWFRSLPIVACLEAGQLALIQGELHINEDSDCSDLEGAFVDALRSSTELSER